MNWIKDVIVDLIVTLFIITSVFFQESWMWWVIIIYTGIMLLAKVVVLAGDSSLQLIRKTKTEVPEWFSHLLYGLNTLALIYGQWWWATAGWLLIWILSFTAQRKLKASQGKV
ncbi:MAG: hypothetical protein U5K69_20585 [Balneolaceae bacterium]|nr:hypothetical protein [Balneolaceae bacterium]